MSDIGAPGQGLRTDLVAGGDTFGDSAEQERQLQALPMAPQPGAGLAQNLAPPPALDGPTTMPNEPVQAGLMSGPGVGPEVLPQAGPELTEATIRRLYAKFPSETLLHLLEKARRG